MEEEIKDFKSMMDSCYAYGGIYKKSWNYERYLKPYLKKLPEDIFNKVYEEYSKELKENYIIINNTYTDNEGLTYNTLKKK